MPPSSETDRRRCRAGVDLHARPAAHFVRTAIGFRSQHRRRPPASARPTRRACSRCSRSAPRRAPRYGSGPTATTAPVAVDALGRCVAGLTD